MNHSSGEDTDISESEVEDCVKKSFEELQRGSHNVKASDQTFSCPYCPKKRKAEYMYKELLQHACGVGEGKSQKRNARDRANHLALVKYLENDVGPVAVPSQLVAEVDALADCDHDEMFVWPWIGVLVNIPTSLQRNGGHVGGSGSKLRDELISRGFNPTRVTPLWNYRGHLGTAVVEFNRGWSGFNNAMTFEKAYEADHHGKKDWKISNDKKFGLYAWVARADDYKSVGILGDHLRKFGDLRTISDVMADEERRTSKLVSNLTNLIEVKNKHFAELESKVSETSSSLTKLMEEKDKLHQSYNEEIKKIQMSARDHFQKIFNDHEIFKVQLASQKRDLEMRGAELEKREARNENERRKLFEEIEQNVTRNDSLLMAAIEQQKADEHIFKLAEDQKRQKEVLHKRIIQLEKQLDAKQALELEIQQMKGTLKVMKPMRDGGYLQMVEKIENMQKVLEERKTDLEALEALNQTLIVKERRSNDELQEARKKLINGLKDMSLSEVSKKKIGVKRMGELDNKPFHDAMKRKYNTSEAKERAIDPCSVWEVYLRDPEWHPFKRIDVNGKPQEVIDENDEMLRGLKDEVGHKAYKAVATALTEINDYNASGRFVTLELWNYAEGRKATLKEAVSVVLKDYRSEQANESNG